jgi:hypothetical protein
MNSTPKGSAGIASLLLAAARAVRKTEDERRPSSPRSILLRRSVGHVAAAYPSRISGWGRAA